MPKRQCHAKEHTVARELPGANSLGADPNPAFHVTQLADVEVKFPHFAVAQEDIRRALQQTLAGGYAVTLALVHRRTEVRREHGFARLLVLEKQRIALVEALEIKQPATGAHASHTHDLAGIVDKAVALQQLSPVGQ